MREDGAPHNVKLYSYANAILDSKYRQALKKVGVELLDDAIKLDYRITWSRTHNIFV